MPLDDLFRQKEANPKAGIGLLALPSCPEEALENTSVLLWVYADSLIPYNNRDSIFSLHSHHYFYFLFFRRIFYGIGNYVYQHLTYSISVSVNCALAFVLNPY